MHVLLTVNAAWNALNFRRGLIRALLAEGCTITVLAPPDETVPALRALGCRFVPLRMNVQGLNPFSDLALVPRLRGILGRERPDVVLSYTIKNNVFSALAARGLSIPVLPNVTGLGTAFLSGGALQAVSERMYRLAFSHVPLVFFQNRDDRDLFLGRRLVRPEQVRMLPGSGIDLEYFTPAPYPGPREETVFLMIGRLLEQKGIREYVAAASALRAQSLPVRFQIIGAVGAENRSAVSQDEVDRWTRDGVIEHLGTSDDVRPHIAASDCVVLPSYREGAPRTLLEAAAMARPVIASDVPGCRDVVEAGTSGLLCPARSGGGLADACRDFLSLSPQERAAMGWAGRHKVEAEFDERLVVAEYRAALSAIRGHDKRMVG